jgi:cytochrome b involved in lipid metabolism
MLIKQPLQYRSFSVSTALQVATGSRCAASPEAKPDQQQQQQDLEQSAAAPAVSFINTTAAAAAAAAASAGAGTSGAAAAAAASAGGVLAGTLAAPTAEYTMRQVSKHATDETCWIVVNGKVSATGGYGCQCHWGLRLSVAVEP